MTGETRGVEDGIKSGILMFGGGDRGHFCLGASTGCTRERRVVLCL